MAYVVISSQGLFFRASADFERQLFQSNWQTANTFIAKCLNCFAVGSGLLWMSFLA